MFSSGLYGNVADERVILFLAISSSDNLRLGDRNGVRVRVKVIVRVRVSTDCGSYFYIPNTRKVYFTVAIHV